MVNEVRRDKKARIESTMRYRKSHPDKVRSIAREYARRRRSAALCILGNTCVKCGFSDIRALQIDHINGGGTKERELGGGNAYWNRIIKSVIAKENKYQLLCANCNWIKRVENKEIRKEKTNERRSSRF